MLGSWCGGWSREKTVPGSLVTRGGGRERSRMSAFFRECCSVTLEQGQKELNQRSLEAGSGLGAHGSSLPLVHAPQLSG